MQWILDPLLIKHHPVKQGMCYVADAPGMEALGDRLAAALGSAGGVIFLCGELGAGKTTLVRGALRRLGVSGSVKSPTYTLIESYELAERTVYHIDLYRLADPQELEYLGLRELDRPEHVLFVEWPERGQESVPLPDLRIRIALDGAGRRVELAAASPRGDKLVIALG
jgi:tRNA threonylcarbamoyladenosine biosynthesis protein TsaE